MIVSISIENFALIEKLQLQLSGGFTVITGETGAGKSILLGALGLVLGKRADLSQLQNSDKKCVIEATFDIKEYNLNSFFIDNDLDYEQQTIIRREILPSGKSRAFVNDTPINLIELQVLSDSLLDIHSQHQTSELLEDQIQMQIIDAVASNKELLSLYRTELQIWKKSTIELKVITQELIESEKEKDYNQFLLEELFVSNLKNTNQSELEEDLEKNNNIDSIKENLAFIAAIASDENVGILNSVKQAKSYLQKIAPYSGDFQSLLERWNSLQIEAEDILQEVSRLEDGIIVQPEILASLNEKLQQLYSLQKKHNVNSVEELLEIQESLDSKALSGEELTDKKAVLESKILASVQKLESFAKDIRANRVVAIPILSEQLEANLKKLGMENAKFQIELQNSSNFLENGMDALTFLFSANKGGNFGLLKKTASGGEISRIMLTIKYILAQYSKLPTILFDEIDTGVSGDIASKMGEMMKQMSKSMQVISITHLPQIASQGVSHFKVFKSENEKQTTTKVEMLNKETRITEIAQMLSGSKITDAALNNAKELLQ
ncbi:MAG: DNA repair protein RecN (Recombination protein N) [Flavobacterium sp.]|jgi:DNA repair protein RecN (Recombination protein N)